MDNLNFNAFCKSVLLHLSNAYPFSKSISFSDIHKDIKPTDELVNYHHKVIQFLINEKLIRVLPIQDVSTTHYQLTPKGFKLFSKNEQIFF